MDEGQTQMTWEELCNEVAKQIERAETAEDRCDALAALARELGDVLRRALEELSTYVEASGGHLGILTDVLIRADKALAEPQERGGEGA